MSIASVITRGFGAFSDIAHVVTRGYLGGSAPPVAPVIDPAFFEDYERARRKSTRRERRRRDDLLAAEQELRRAVEEAVRGPPVPALVPVLEAGKEVIAAIESPRIEVTPQRARAASRAILLALEEIRWQMGMEADDEAALEALLLA